MTPRQGRFILLAVAVLLLAFSFWRSLSFEREKRRMAEAYQQTQQLVKRLEKEQTALTHELGEARQTIEGQQGELTHVKVDLQDLQRQLDHATTEMASLQREQEDLQTQNSSLISRIGAVMAEKQRLEARLASLKELKLAIHDVTRQIKQERLAAWQARVHTFQQADRERLASGNRGYLMRNGKPTMGSGARLEVHVLEPQPQ